MPSYTFHRMDDAADAEPMRRELGSDEDARIEAVVYAAEILSEHPEFVWTGRDLEVQVADERGEMLFSITTKGKRHANQV